MGIEEQFSSSYGRRDQGPNRQLAKAIISGQDDDAISQIFELFGRKASTRVKNDAVLTIAAVSEEAPKLLTPYVPELTSLLRATVNRQVFGAMITLANLSSLVPKALMSHLTLILDAMDTGTVVTRDHGFTILTELYKVDKEQLLLPLILEQLMKAPPNQLGQYAEKFIKVMHFEHRDQLATVLEERLPELENDHHRARMAKNLKKISRV